MDEMGEDTLQMHVIFVLFCNFARCTLHVVLCTLYFARFFFISVLEASKQIFVLVAGFKLLYWLQTFCTGLQISGNRCLYWLQTFCTVQFFVLVAGFRCLFVDLKTEQKNKLSFVFCSNTDVCCIVLTFYPKNYFGIIMTMMITIIICTIQKNLADNVLALNFGHRHGHRHGHRQRHRRRHRQRHRQRHRHLRRLGRRSCLKCLKKCHQKTSLKNCPYFRNCRTYFNILHYITYIHTHQISLNKQTNKQTNSEALSFSLTYLLT